jgi:predicted nucleotidyltransferase
MASIPSVAAIAAALTRVLDQCALPPIVSAYVFGSVARGTAHRESDVDLGVLFDYAHSNADSRFAARLRLATRLAERLRIERVDLVVLNDAPPTLGRRIITEGLRLACFDAEGDHAFVRDVQLRAADLEPFLRRTRRIKLAAIGS